MNKKTASLVLYPILASNITKKQKDLIVNLFTDLELSEIEEIVKTRITPEDVKNIADKLKVKEKKEIFNLSKLIADNETLSLSQIKAFKELGTILDIQENETGFSFNIYNDNEIIDYEYKRTLTNYSVIASAVGFIPFIPVSDYFILTPLQIGMVSKISNLFNFKLDAEQFIKMLAGTLGAGFVFRGVSQIINRFIPFVGWIINASVAFAGTYAIGIIAKRYIELNGDLSGENIKTLWETSFNEGKEEFGKLKDFILEKKDDLIKYFNTSLKDNENETYEDSEENTTDIKDDEESEDYRNQPQQEEKKSGTKKRPRKKTKDDNDDDLNSFN